jgi:hypothetical protein
MIITLKTVNIKNKTFLTLQKYNSLTNKNNRYSMRLTRNKFFFIVILNILFLIVKWILN